MSREKQIEEMERELREYGRTYDNDVMYGCDDLSEYLVVNKGYAKASEVAREIFEEIYDRLMTSFPTSSFIDAPCTTENRLYSMLAELKKKYTEV